MADVGPGGSPRHLCRARRVGLARRGLRRDRRSGELLGLAGRPAADLGGLLLLAAVVAMAAQQPGANSSRSSRTDPAAMTAQAAPWRWRGRTPR